MPTTSSRIPRALFTTAIAVVSLHVLTSIFLGPTHMGSLIGNSLQIFASFLAAAYCFQAATRSPGFSRSFWILVACSIAMWGIATVGWTYYEILLQRKPATGSLIRYLFDTHGMFLLMAIFLDQEKKDSRLELQELFDFFQIGIVFFLIYFGMYYLPAVGLTQPEALRREVFVVLSEDLAVALLATLQWKRSRHPGTARLFGGLAAYITIFAIFAIVAELVQFRRPSPTGTWLDLAWTLPLLFGAFWAATWRPVEGEEARREIRTKSLTEVLLTNGIFALLPLMILFQVTQLGPNWRLVRFGLLAASFACYAARVGFTEFRQQQGAETVRRQALAMDSAIDGIAIVNEKGLHIYANNAFAQMLGFDGPERIVGQPWRVVYAFQDMNRLEPEIRKSLARTRKWTSPLQLRRPNGTFLSVELMITATPDGGTACVCRDLSQREHAERAREDAEAKYRMLVEHVNAITYIAEIGMEGQWYYVSPQVEAILGYSADEWLAISRDWALHIHPDDIPGVAAAESASEKGFPFQAEFRIRRKDGREVWLSDTAVVVKGSNAHPVMEGIMVDITDRKVLETQLQQSRKMEAVGRLAGGIAHDFNNLLTIITGYTDLALSRASVPLEIRADIERIENAAGRAASLVQQLLAFSRKQVLQPRTLDVNAIVLNLDKLLRRLMDDNIELITRAHDNVGKVKADPAQLEQVIMNLLVNARDALPKGGRIVLETSNVDLDSHYAEDHATVKPGRYVMLAVSDTGVGMSQETVAHIFEPFFTTKESGRGTGLGLSTVYGIVKQSGGYIWVYSEPGRGSTFKVYLPRVEEFPEDAAAPAGQLHGTKGTETILLVEDEEAVRELIETVLREQGYDVVAARDTRHAEELAKDFDREIHMLLTDVVMPGTSGRELAVRIAALRPAIRILYMSGYTDNVITTGGMLEKGLAFLQKPFSPTVLVQKVREVLSQTPAV